MSKPMLHRLGSIKELKDAIKHGAMLTLGKWSLYDRAGYWWIESGEGGEKKQFTDFEWALLTLLGYNDATLTQQEE